MPSAVPIAFQLSGFLAFQDYQIINTDYQDYWITGLLDYWITRLPWHLHGLPGLPDCQDCQIAGLLDCLDCQIGKML